VLCPSCRRQIERGASYCGSCGSPLQGSSAPLELVLGDDTRVPVVREMTLGRAPGSTVVLADPTVSRLHARIHADGRPRNGNGDGVVIEDAGSSHGTWLDGVRVTGPVPLHDGAKIRLGKHELAVERQRDTAEAGRTIVVRPGASLVVPAAGAPGMTAQATQFGMKPRVRSGYALKRLDASEGNRRWVLKDLRSDRFLRLSDNDAKIFEMLDGRNSLVDLIGKAEQKFGPTGAARLARLLGDLGDRGFLAGVAGTQTALEAPPSTLKRLMKPREKVFTGVGDFFDKLYRGGAWVLFTRPALIAIATIGVTGVAAFVYLVAGRYGTPFVVAKKVGLGGLVFLLGRFALAAVHETAHGLTMASFGRKVHKAGFKLLMIFPYVYVDTSEAWFEPRKRRIAISAAGAVSDFSLAGLFSLICLLLGPGTIRDIFFNLSFAGFVGAFFNLNPFIERDGYHILVDVLREPGLRRRAREQFARRLSGKKVAGDSPVLARYSVWGLAWTSLASVFAVGMSLRYKAVLDALAAPWIVWTVMATVWVALFVPVLIVLVKPLKERFSGAAEA
jgi:putative peptide zinc metalloprotease protein